MNKVNYTAAQTSTISTPYSIPFVSCSCPTLSNTSPFINPSPQTSFDIQEDIIPLIYGPPLIMSDGFTSSIIWVPSVIVVAQDTRDSVLCGVIHYQNLFRLGPTCRASCKACSLFRWFL